jgi:hypothetical protein
MPELLVDFITSLEGYASAEGWPGWWENNVGLSPARMGCTNNSDSSINPRSAKASGRVRPSTYRPLPGSRLSCWAAFPGSPCTSSAFQSTRSREPDTRASKVVFSASLEEPLARASSTLVRDDAVEAVRAIDGSIQLVEYRPRVLEHPPLGTTTG